MSLLEPFRKLWSKNIDLEKNFNSILEENKKLKKEIEQYKLLLYNIEITEAAKRFKR